MTNSRRRIVWTCPFVILVFGLPLIASDQETSKRHRWEPAIAKFEAADGVTPPPQNGILFVGSSSIRQWDLTESFPGLPVINRGFGGSVVADTLHFADRIILPYKPAVVVVYAGDNDIARGNTPQQVHADVQLLLHTIHERAPETQVIFIAIKPSLKRWPLIDRIREANRLVQALAEKESLLEYADVDGPMIGADGRPRAELFVKDGLHLSAEGYRLWGSIVKPLIVPRQ